MKNSKLFPFERNKYYYGKLLSVNDFELEQKYMNDKRRAVNRLLFGSGVAAGMYVLLVDDFTISVERGIALDYSGREIVIEEPVIKKLSLIEGYDAYTQLGGRGGYVYLCLEYAEEDAEPVYNIAGKNTALSGTDYNKVREGYRLFLTDREPEGDHQSFRELYTDTKTIYWGNGIRIRQMVPRFVRSGGKARVRIEVENMGQQQLFAFSYDLALQCLSFEGKSHLRISFNEAFFERAGRYEMTYVLDAHEVSDVEGSISIEEESFLLSVEQRRLNARAEGRQSVKITANSEISEMVKAYYQENMETFLRNNFQQSIYLAKISLISAGGSYVIQKVENIPFGQYIYSNELLAAMGEMLRGGFNQSGNKDSQGEPGETGAYGDVSAAMNFAQGEITIHLGEKAIRGKRFYSGEIVHGLGIGQATIVLSQVREDGTQLYGSSEVFEDVDPAVEMAALLNRDKGSFVIGVRPLAESMKDCVTVHWTAFKDTKEYEEEKKERRIFIKPNVLNLKLRESAYLEAVCTNMKDKRLKWAVRDNGGTIDNNGMYTAPNMAGVFEVTAQSVAYPEVRASVFVIVREPGEE